MFSTLATAPDTHTAGPKVSPDLGYRPDIDGLRAVAVVAVVLFHAELAAFAGGYVGVDVFFVISGYLITQRVVASVEQGRFSATEFYRRRVRRLLPAASSTVIVTLVAGLAILPAYRFRDLGVSAVAASTSWSNVLFWTEAGYWDAEALTKPLLHTWSLSVEEQFYLLWPVTLVFLVGRFGRQAIRPIVALGVASLVVTTLLTPSLPSAAFYLTPFRAYEFLIGAGCVWLDGRAWPDTAVAARARAALFVVGVTAILVAVFGFDASTIFPGAAALVPTLGTAAVILARAPGGPARLLTNPVARWFGLTSYSLYLVHWPLLVLADHVTGGLSPLTLAVVLPVSVMLAGIQYRHVEQRFRMRSGAVPPTRARPRARPVLAVASTTALAGVGLAAAGPWFVAATAEEETRVVLDGGDEREVVELTPLVDIASRPMSEVNNDRTRASHLLCDREEKVLCGQPVADARTILVLGDSQGPGTLNALRVAAPDANLMISSEGGCPPLRDLTGVEYRDPHCEEFNDRRFAAVEEVADRVDLVVVSMRLQPARESNLRDTIEWLQGLGTQVAVMGVGPEYERPAWELALDHGTRDGLDEAMAAHLRPGSFATDDAYAAMVRDAGATYLQRLDVLCPEQRCQTLVPGADALAIHDNTHMTLPAAEMVGRALRESYPELFRS